MSVEAYERVAAGLVEEESRLKSQLAAVSERLSSVRAALDAQRADIEAFPDDPEFLSSDAEPEGPEEAPTSQPGPAPEPVAPVTRTTPVTPAKSATNVVKIKAPRRDRIWQILAQGAERWWRVNEITVALGEANNKIVRLTVDKMVDKGEVLKHWASKNETWYRFNDGVDRPAPSASAASDEDAPIDEQGATM